MFAARRLAAPRVPSLTAALPRGVSQPCLDGISKSAALIPAICGTQRFGIARTSERGDMETVRLNSALHPWRVAPVCHKPLLSQSPRKVSEVPVIKYPLGKVIFSES